MRINTEPQGVEEWCFAMFESKYILMVFRSVDSANDQSSLMPDILSCDTSSLVWTYARLSNGDFWDWTKKWEVLLASRRRVSRT